MLTNQSLGQSLNSGGTISLSVGIFGSAPLIYQWYRSGLPIFGATNSSYVKANAQAADSGFYFAIAANCSGSITSYPVLVQVIEPPYTLIGLTNQFWRYNQSGTNLGTAWKEVSYDDSLWPSGRGLFAFENHVVINALTNTVLSLSNAAGASIITYYFRTTFVVTNDFDLMSLVASNYIDDGAIIFVNGSEAFRFNMPNGLASNTTLAVLANPLGEGIPIVSNIPPELVVKGTNVIAAEVHQYVTNNTDVVFGLALFARNIPPGPPVLGSNPSGTNVFAGENLNLAATILVGTDLHYQWFKDGSALASATNAICLLSNVTLADAGHYWIVVRIQSYLMWSRPLAQMATRASWWCFPSLLRPLRPQTPQTILSRHS